MPSAPPDAMPTSMFCGLPVIAATEPAVSSPVKAPGGGQRAAANSIDPLTPTEEGTDHDASPEAARDADEPESQQVALECLR